MDPQLINGMVGKVLRAVDTVESFGVPLPGDKGARSAIGFFVFALVCGSFMMGFFFSRRVFAGVAGLGPLLALALQLHAPDGGAAARTATWLAPTLASLPLEARSFIGSIGLVLAIGFPLLPLVFLPALIKLYMLCTGLAMYFARDSVAALAGSGGLGAVDTTTEALSLSFCVTLALGCPLVFMAFFGRESRYGTALTAPVLGLACWAVLEPPASMHALTDLVARKLPVPAGPLLAAGRKAAAPYLSFMMGTPARRVAVLTCAMVVAVGMLLGLAILEPKGPRKGKRTGGAGSPTKGSDPNSPTKTSPPTKSTVAAMTPGETRKENSPPRNRDGTPVDVKKGRK